MAEPLRTPTSRRNISLLGVPTAEDLEAKDVSELDPADLNRKRRQLLDQIRNEAGTTGGALDPELEDTVRESAADLGVSQSSLDSTLQRERIGIGAPVAEEQPDPFASEQAAQDVMYQREFGSGIDAGKRMQDPDYVLGSGSSLRQAPRLIGPKSGAMRREARRLRKQGYTAQAGQLAGAAAQQKLMEGSAIKSEGARALETAQQMQAGQLARQQQDLASNQINYANKLLQRRTADIEDTRTRTPQDAPADFDDRFSRRRAYRSLLDLEGGTPFFDGRNKFFDFR